LIGPLAAANFSSAASNSAGPARRRIHQRQLRLDQLDLGGARGKCRVGIDADVAGRVGERRQNHGNFANERVEGTAPAPRATGGTAELQRPQQHFLERELERGDDSVRVDQLVKGG
jgi:hypothetical protein